MKPFKVTPLMAKAIEVRFCVKYLRQHAAAGHDDTAIHATRCVVATHLNRSDVSNVVIRALVPSAEEWGF